MTINSIATTPNIVTRDIKMSEKFLLLPIRNNEKRRLFTISISGENVREFNVCLAGDKPEWWASIDMSLWIGETVTLTTVLPEYSTALSKVRQSNNEAIPHNLYKEKLRPQLQYTTKHGWINDPNGLVYYNGEYHMFYQYNPYAVQWDIMHWGHATSKDLLHWKEHGVALYPDKTGAMYSGCAVVDWNNTSGLGASSSPPLILHYTSFAKYTWPEVGDLSAVQCLAFSNDGYVFTKIESTPVIAQITKSNRDPKTFWYEPTQRWITVLYVAQPNGDNLLDTAAPLNNIHTIHFLESKNLLEWSPLSIIDGASYKDDFLFECPDFFELPIDGDMNNKKWVLTSASSDYIIGTFNGVVFTPETEKLTGHTGVNYYAPQTFSDLPCNRRIQIGWHKTPTRGMCFTQLQTFPCELKLINTHQGVRLSRSPIKEIETLRVKTHTMTLVNLFMGRPNPFSHIKGELLEIRAVFTPTTDSIVIFMIRGIEVLYDTSSGIITVNGVDSLAPLHNNKLDVIILVDRTNITVWASEGCVYMPIPVVPKIDDLCIQVSVCSGSVLFNKVEIHTLKSIWR